MDFGLTSSTGITLTRLAEKPAPDAAQPAAPLIGTDVLGRPLTADEKKHWDRVLRQHDFNGARRYALLFGQRLTRNVARAEDVVGRACLRLVRWGWDPSEVTLAKRLCRLVWSEWTHEKREDRRRRNAEEKFLAEMAVHEGTHSRSTEEYTTQLEQDREDEEHAKRQLDRLRAAFVKKNDAVNLLWLQFTLDGVEDVSVMAHKSGRNVGEFYDAADRRKRLTNALLAEDNGVKHDPEEKPR
jgi:DNA-directed RNA polymerase specialized sigma24 family protein